MSQLKVHPVADLFPMLAEDELKELAADIIERGLLHPIVLDGPEGDGWLLDGRNRLAACEMAGVEPTFTQYDGSDPIGYILAANINRRHLAKGQQAIVMAGARRYSSGITQQAASAVSGVSQPMIAKAEIVVDHAPDLAARVLDGTTPLNDAYEEARERKRAAEEAKAKLERLRANAPDLATLVDGEKMHLDDAIAALEAREEKARRDEEERRTKAEQEAERARLEEVEAQQRHRSRLEMFITGWSTFRDVVVRAAEEERTQQILGLLGDTDRQVLKEIISELPGVADELA